MWNRYPYFLYPPSIHMLTLSCYLFITESAGTAITFSSRQARWFPFSAFLTHSLAPSPFPMSSSSLIPSLSYLTIRVSSFQPKSISTDIPTVPLSLSAPLSLRPSMISWVPAVISSSPAFQEQGRKKVVLCDRSVPLVCWKGNNLLFTAIAFL